MDFRDRNRCLGELRMSIHHCKERLYVIELLHRSCIFFIAVKFSNLLWADGKKDLVRLLSFENLCGSTLIDYVNFDRVGHKLRLIDHLRCFVVRLLIESILYELFLEQEVLGLLLLTAFTLLVRLGIHDTQLGHFLLLLEVHCQVFHDKIAILILPIFSLDLTADEFWALVRSSPQLFISSVESLIVHVFMIVNTVSGSHSELLELFVSQLVLVKDFLTVIVKLYIIEFWIFLVILALCVKLILALDLNLLKSTSLVFSLLLNRLSYLL